MARFSTVMARCVGSGGRDSAEAVTTENENCAGGNVRREHRLGNGEDDAWLVAERVDPAFAGIEARVGGNRWE